MEDYKNKSTKELLEKEKVQKVVSNSVVVKKKGILDKFNELFVLEDVHSVFKYVIQDIVIPKLKEMFKDSVDGGLDAWLHGTSRPVNRNNQSRVQYGKYYDQSPPYNPQRRDKSVMDWSTIEYSSRYDAENVLKAMKETIRKFDLVTVAKFYEFSGINEYDYNAYDFGWINIDDAYIDRSRRGYVIRLPKPSSIE